MVALGLTSMASFASTCADDALFADKTPLTVDGFSAATATGSTLAGMSALLSVDVASLAVASQDISGLLTGVIWVNGVEYIAAPSTSISSLANLIPGMTVPDLALHIAEQPVLASGMELYVLSWVPQYSLSTTRINLDSASSPVNMLLRVNQPGSWQRLLLNLNVALTALEYRVEPAPSVTGYEHSERLQFLQPLAGTAATLETSVGQLAVPVPLRTYPDPIQLLVQTPNPTPGAETATSIRLAKQWDFAAAFELADAAQDAVEFSIGINFRVPQLNVLRSVERDPFDTLAAFTTNFAAIREDLDNLTLPLELLRNNATMLAATRSALSAMATYATDLAVTWGPVRPTTAGSSQVESLVPSETFQFDLQTQRIFGQQGKPLINSVTLTLRQDSSWGPAGQLPSLAYVDPDNSVVMLTHNDVPAGSTPAQLLFTLPAPVDEDSHRQFILSYTGLDIFQVQSARLSAAISRNQRLLIGQTTNDEFVYQTPIVSFGEIAMPTNTNQQHIVIGTKGSSTLSEALAAAFTSMLNATPATATQQTVKAAYAIPLTPLDLPVPEGIEPLEREFPIFLMPAFTYSSDVPTAIATQLQAWLANLEAQEGSIPTGAVLRLDVTSFASALGGPMPPLLRLARLEYKLSA